MQEQKESENTLDCQSKDIIDKPENEKNYLKEFLADLRMEQLETA